MADGTAQKFLNTCSIQSVLDAQIQPRSYKLTKILQCVCVCNSVRAFMPNSHEHHR